MKLPRQFLTRPSHVSSPYAERMTRAGLDGLLQDFYKAHPLQAEVSQACVLHIRAESGSLAYWGTPSTVHAAAV